MSEEYLLEIIDILKTMNTELHNSPNDVYFGINKDLLEIEKRVKEGIRCREEAIQKIVHQEMHREDLLSYNKVEKKQIH